MKLQELKETLQSDKVKYQAVLKVAANRKAEVDNAAVKLAKTINPSLLLKGTGGAEHERELMKVLAVAGVKYEDLGDKDTMELIQEVLTDFIADEEMDEDELEFAARGLAF